jgi:hypothetical protein
MMHVHVRYVPGHQAEEQDRSVEFRYQYGSILCIVNGIVWHGDKGGGHLFVFQSEHFLPLSKRGAVDTTPLMAVCLNSKTRS